MPGEVFNEHFGAAALAPAGTDELDPVLPLVRAVLRVDRLGKPLRDLRHGLVVGRAALACQPVLAPIDRRPELYAQQMPGRTELAQLRVLADDAIRARGRKAELSSQAGHQPLVKGQVLDRAR